MRYTLAKALLTGLLTVGTSVAVSPAPAHAADVTAAQLLTALPVAAEGATPYSRDFFEHWTDADGDGCDTRQEVLLAESHEEPAVGPGCSVSGLWWSFVDNMEWRDTARLDVDHHVPLEEAWQSGASGWTAAQRRDFANDLTFFGSLNAITDTVNSSKGSQDPAQWMPPYTDRSCDYATMWVGVKYRWSLSVDAAEKSALTGLLSGSCGATVVTVDKAAVPAPQTSTDRLAAGQTLAAGKALLSANAAYRLVMQTDGNLVAYKVGGGAIWSSRTGGNPGARLVMQTDGNLVVYSTANRALWSNGARGAGSRLVVQNDGNVVEYSGTNAVLWHIRRATTTTTAPAPAPAPAGTLTIGRRLSAGQQLTSANGSYRLSLQSDGNLVVYTAAGRAAWSTGTRGTGAYLVMQGDGNAVLYGSGRALWYTRTGGNPGARLVMQGDGNLVVYSTANRVLWQSGVPRPPSTSAPANPGNSRNCGDFSTWRAAQDWYDRYYPYYGDVAALDADGDRIACESLPGAP